MIEIDQGGPVWVIRLARPEKANSLTPEMLEALIEAVANARADAQTRAVILTGTGDRAFSAGADLEAAKAGLATSPLWERLSTAIADLPCLSIAALNGTVAGGAMGMALACDLRISVPHARIFYPVAKLGFLPQPSDPKRMKALIGPARTKMILLAGEKISAEDALAWGLIDRIVPAEDLLAICHALTEDAVAGPDGHVRAIKALC